MRTDFVGLNKLSEIQEEIRVSQIYNVDHRTRKGMVRMNIDKLHPHHIPCIVTEIRSETPSTKTIRLTPKDGYIPPFYPGQYINLSVEVKGVRTNRPYSISSSAAERRFYEITVRASANGFVSDWLQNHLKVGDKLECSGPAGQFYRFDAVHGKKLVFIAGGSGITPFFSMLQSDRDKFREDYTIDLIYGSSDQKDVIFQNQLTALAKELPGFHWHPIISGPGADSKAATGLITADFIKKIVSDVDERTFFLCGPSEMYDFVLPQLDKLGVRKSRIRKEVQTTSSDPTKLPAWPQGVAASSSFTITLPNGKSVQAKATDTILETLEKGGFQVRSQCRSGKCSLCRTKLRSGKVFQPESVLLRRGDMRFGYIHPCVTYPISDIELLL